MTLQDKIQRKVQEFCTNITRKRVQRFAGNPLLRKGKFYLPEEWEQRRQKRRRMLREISQLLYPEKYPT